MRLDIRIGLFSKDLGAREGASGGGGWRGLVGNPGGELGDGVPDGVGDGWAVGEFGADGLAWP